MEQKNIVLVICESLAREIEKIVPPNLEIREIELGLHDYPKKLNEKLSRVLSELEEEQEWDVILLGFGLCSEGTVGLKAKRARLVLPKTDDCIAIFLGSREVYMEQFRKQPGTYYFTKGFLKDGTGPLAMYLGEHEWTRKYSKEKAQWLAKEMMKNYRRAALIDTGVYDITPYIAKVKKTAEVFGLEFEIIPGSLAILEALVQGPWDDRFVVVEPGQEITRQMFYNG